MKIIILLLLLLITLFFVGTLAVEERKSRTLAVEERISQTLAVEERKSRTLVGEERKRRTLRGGSDSIPDSSSKVNVVVEFKTEQGKNDAIQMANKVLYESKLFSVVAIEIHSKYIKELKKNPNIQSVGFDEQVHAIRPADPPTNKSSPQESSNKKNKGKDRRDLVEQVPWGIQAVRADKVSPGPDASSIKVCIIDSGYDLNHPDLPKSTVTGTDSRRYSKNEGYRWNEDVDGHGTHMAGIIAALGTNNQGVRGVIADESIRLHIAKGLDNKGDGSISNIIEMVEACISAGSDIISMSFTPSSASSGSSFNSFSDIL